MLVREWRCGGVHASCRIESRYMKAGDHRIPTVLQCLRSLEPRPVHVVPHTAQYIEYRTVSRDIKIALLTASSRTSSPLNTQETIGARHSFFKIHAFQP